MLEVIGNTHDLQKDARMAEPITTTAIKEILKAVISDDIKITISRDEFISGTAKIRLEGKNNRYEQLVNHLDLGFSPGLVDHVSLLIIKALHDMQKDARKGGENK